MTLDSFKSMGKLNSMKKFNPSNTPRNSSKGAQSYQQQDGVEFEYVLYLIRFHFQQLENIFSCADKIQNTFSLI